MSKKIIIFCLNVSNYKAYCEKYKNVVDCVSDIEEVITIANKELSQETELSTTGLIKLDDFKDYFSAVLFLISDKYLYSDFTEVPTNNEFYKDIEIFAKTIN